MEELLERAIGGDRRSLARVFTLIERDREALAHVMKRVYSLAGRAAVIGITGPPGAGKSTIVDGLARQARSEGKTVGVLAIDPTSPFSGGAVLGDRIRMQGHHLDRDVFIRSIATRGASGGLAEVSGAAVSLLDAAGKDLILVETTGVGQTELDIEGLADVVAVVLVPESGDSVQAMKAGLLEIADVFIINKADRDGAGQMASAVRSMIALDQRPPERRPPVLMTQAHIGEGLPELYRRAMKECDDLRQSGELAERRSRRAQDEVERLITGRLAALVARLLTEDERAAALMDKVASGDLDPHSAARRILKALEWDAPTGRGGEIRHSVRNDGAAFANIRRPETGGSRGDSRS